MLSKEDNELITRVGPGTVMGRLMREYWVPALLASELPRPDCDPVRVLLLGEQLIGFRDTSGRVGLIQNHCPHRGASLFYGRNEGDGLRCVYHGWKFNVAGRCTEMPNEPPESQFKSKVRATAYPCVERGGIVWAYMGPREAPPPLPDLEANQLPEGQWQVGAIMRDCNWLQALEGDIDDSHVPFLHFGSINAEDMPPDSFIAYATQNRLLRFEVVDAEYGAMYGAYRPASLGKTYWRIGQFMFPFYTQIPTGILGSQILTQAWVPMDDDHTLWFRLSSTFEDPNAEVAKADSANGQKGNSPLEKLRNRVRAGGRMRPNTSDWLGRFRTEADATNDYRIDRQSQRDGTFSGMPDLIAEDQSVTEGMGPIYDRTQEHLGTADQMVIRTRHRLLQVARALRATGTVPPGVDNPEIYRVRSGGLILPEAEDWLAAVDKWGRAYEQHSDLDLGPEKFWRHTSSRTSESPGSASGSTARALKP